MKIPDHIAIIMDGNGRWATSRGRSRTYGHIRGARTAKKIIRSAAGRNISHLTLFAFSTENWLRPQQEVSFLMRLLGHQIRREQTSLMKNNIRFGVIGNMAALPEQIRNALQKTIEMTAQNTGMTLTFALSYGGRQEIVEAARNLAHDVYTGKISVDKIDENIFSKYLPSYGLPDPDLIIRTSGESRISNFFLWQAAYSEIIILEKLWPDFTTTDLESAIHEYSRRDRRFGKIHSSESHLNEEPHENIRVVSSPAREHDAL